MGESTETPGVRRDAGCGGVGTRGYLDLVSYIVSNAVSGEIMAIENYSELVLMVPGTEDKIRFVDFAAQEAKHIRMLSKLGRRLDFHVEQRIVEPQWSRVRAHFREAAAKGDLLSCVLIQDLMVETMAVSLYETLAGRRDAVTDGATAATAASILRDEHEHLGYATDQLRLALERDRPAAEDALVWCHQRVMPELYSLASTSCESLCDVLGVDCGDLTLDDLRTDLDSLRFDALERYTESLDTARVGSRLANQLVASLLTYDDMPRASAKLMKCDSEGCCG